MNGESGKFSGEDPPDRLLLVVDVAHVPLQIGRYGEGAVAVFALVRLLACTDRDNRRGEFQVSFIQVKHSSSDTLHNVRKIPGKFRRL